MPWTTEDVDKFKKDLSDEQKKKWVSIANSALENCQKEGGSDCEAKAIRIANSQIGSTENKQAEFLSNEITSNMSELIVQKEMDGKEYFVAPVILITEGVHSGSGGPTYYPVEELEKFPQAWNGRPIPVYHPKKDGSPTTANDPELIQNCSVGQIFNVRFEDGKLKGEAWINPEKANKVDPDVMRKLNNNEVLEVSTGMFVEEEVKEGEWNGEKYTRIARSIRPDHLALLPNGKGACSVEDGGGMPRINEEQESELFSRFTKYVLNLLRKEKDLESERSKNNNKGEQRMSKIDDLIANTNTRLTEDDRGMLENLEEDTIDKLFPVAEKEGEKENEEQEPVESNEEQKEEKPLTLNDLLEKADPAIRDSIEEGQRMIVQKRTALVDKIVENSDFTKEDLEGKKIPELEKLAKLAKADVDYSLQSNSEAEEHRDEEDAIPEPPVINWETGKVEDEKESE